MWDADRNRILAENEFTPWAGYNWGYGVNQVATGIGDGVTTTGAIGAQPLIRPTPVSRIKDKDVVNLRGEELGEIERVILGTGDQVYAVMEFGGFLGLGEEKRIVPLRAMMLREDRIVMPCVSEAELKALPEWTEGSAGYRELETTYMAPFGLYPTAAR